MAEHQEVLAAVSTEMVGRSDVGNAHRAQVAYVMMSEARLEAWKSVILSEEQRLAVSERVSVFVLVSPGILVKKVVERFRVGERWVL